MRSRGEGRCETCEWWHELGHTPTEWRYGLCLIDGEGRSRQLHRCDHACSSHLQRSRREWRRHDQDGIDWSDDDDDQA